MKKSLSLSAVLIALTALFTAPAHAQVIGTQVYSRTATSGGCTAVFMSRTTNDGGIASGTGSFTAWVKITDTCGLAASNQADFADMGFCTAGPLADASPCSIHGLVFRSWTVASNCGRTLLSQTDGAAYTGVPAAACAGTPIY
jgi:hypothetical protein